MKTFYSLIFAFAVATLPALAQTQSEMNQEADDDFKKADAALNKVYKELRDSLDEDMQAKLKTAQKAWLAYRDAEAALEAAPSEGGSIYPLDLAVAKTRLTESRTEELQNIINGDDSDEGDEENTSSDDEEETEQAGVPRDANGTPYGKDYNPDGADDPNM